MKLFLNMKLWNYSTIEVHNVRNFIGTFQVHIKTVEYIFNIAAL